MRFLCLHGNGTSNKVFEMQIATLRNELGGNHTYEFAEGSIPVEAEPGIKHLFPADDEYFSYFDPSKAGSLASVLVDLESYIAAEGPFGGIVGFSGGAGIAATLLLRMAANGMDVAPFKCAIFLSAMVPFDEDPRKDIGAVELLELPIGHKQINMPTAHVWGCNDEWQDRAKILASMCQQEKRSVFVHEGGHEVPSSSRSREAVLKAAHTIKRAIFLAGDR